MNILVRGRLIDGEAGAQIEAGAWKLQTSSSAPPDARVGDTVRVAGRLIDVAAQRVPAGYRSGTIGEGGRVELQGELQREQEAPTRPRPSVGELALGSSLLGLGVLALGLGPPSSVAENVLRGAWLALAVSSAWVLAARRLGYLHVYPMAPRFEWLPQFAETYTGEEARARRGVVPVGTTIAVLLFVVTSAPFTVPFLLARADLLPAPMARGVLKADALLWLPALAALSFTAAVIAVTLRRGAPHWAQAVALLRGRAFTISEPFAYGRQVDIAYEEVSAARGKRTVATLRETQYSPPSAYSSRVGNDRAECGVLPTDRPSHIALSHAEWSRARCVVLGWPGSPALAATGSTGGVIFVAVAGSTAERQLRLAMARHLGVLTGPLVGLALVLGLNG